MLDLDKNYVGDIVLEALGGVKEFHAAVLDFDILNHLSSQECLFVNSYKNCS